MKTLIKYFTLAASIAALAVSARAVPTLVLWDGTSLVIVTDNAAGNVVPVGGYIGAGTFLANDNLGTPGAENNAVSFSGKINNWTVNVTTALAYGSQMQPILDLNSFDKSVGPGFLEIAFVADGFNTSLLPNPNGSSFFGPAPAGGSGVHDTIGGTTAGDVEYTNWIGHGSYLQGTSMITQITPWVWANPIPYPLPGSVLVGSTQNGVIPAGPYTLTALVAIFHYGQGIQVTSFDYEKDVPDSGMTALLLGLGLLGVGLAARRFKA